MSAFKALQDVSHGFESELRQVSEELYSAKIGDTFDDSVAKKLRDLSFFSAKLKLLRAKPVALTPDIAERPKSDLTLTEYGEEVCTKLLEQMTVKTITHTHAVKTLLTTQDGKLDPEMRDRKEKIITSLSEYSNMETRLRHMETLLKERRAEYMSVREQWDKELGELRDTREEVVDDEDLETSGPLYSRLRTFVDKLELMRWLLGRLVTTRGHRDWLAEPRQALHALKLARTANTVEMFTHMS